MPQPPVPEGAPPGHLVDVHGRHRALDCPHALRPRQHSGSHFDPGVVAAFLARERGFFELARAFADDDAGPPERAGTDAPNLG